MNSVQASHIKGCTSDVDDHYLTPDHDAVDTEEPVVPEHAFEDVQLVVKSPVVKLIENLHPNEGVENDSVELQLTFVGAETAPEKLVASEVEHKGDGKLVNGLSNNHLPHSHSEKRCTLGDGLAVENLFCRGVSCKCEGSKRVHDQINPEQLNRTQDTRIVTSVERRDKGQDDSSNVDCDLELEKL